MTDLDALARRIAETIAVDLVAPWGEQATSIIANALREAYAAGAREMRERAARQVEHFHIFPVPRNRILAANLRSIFASEIRALPTTRETP